MTSSSSGPLLIDIDDDCDSPLAPHDVLRPQKRFKNGGANVRSGPSSYEAIFDWPSEGKRVGQDYIAASQLEEQAGQFFTKKIYVTTTYAGAQTVEHVFSCIKEEYGLSDDAVIFWSSTDNSPLCMRLALNSKRPPVHVFNDITERVPKNVLKKMEFVRATFIKRFEEQLENTQMNAKQRRHLLDQLGGRCRQKLRKELRAIACSRDLKAYCHKHHTMCHIWPQDMREDDVHVEAGGNTCVGFSPQGSQLRWLDDSAVPCAIWLFMAELAAPDVLLDECSHHFNTKQVLDEFFPDSKGWKVSVIMLAPTDVGLPYTRPRNFALVYNHKWKSLIPLDYNTFMSIMGSRPRLTGHIFFRDLPTCQQNWVEEQLARRKIVPPTTVPKQIDPDSVLTPGSRARLKVYKSARDGMQLPLAFSPVLDLSQNQTVRGSFSDNLSSLLCKSEPFSMSANRGMAKLEAWGVQAFPHPRLLEGTSSERAEQFPFDCAVTDALTYAEVWGSWEMQ